MTVNPSPLDAETQFCLYTAPTIQIRCSQLGVILLFWGHLAVFEKNYNKLILKEYFSYNTLTLSYIQYSIIDKVYEHIYSSIVTCRMPKILGDILASGFQVDVHQIQQEVFEKYPSTQTNQVKILKMVCPGIRLFFLNSHWILMCPGLSAIQ